MMCTSTGCAVESSALPIIFSSRARVRKNRSRRCRRTLPLALPGCLVVAISEIRCNPLHLNYTCSPHNACGGGRCCSVRHARPQSTRVWIANLLAWANFAVRVSNMKKLLVVLSASALAGAAVFAAALFAQEKTVVNVDEIQIRQLERAWNEAEARHDAVATSQIVGDGLSYIDFDG